MLCECGCGYDGPDPVTQYLIEEALLARLEVEDAVNDSARVEADVKQRVIDEQLAHRDRLIKARPR